MVLGYASHCSCVENGEQGRITLSSLRDHHRLRGRGERTGELHDPEPDILMLVTTVFVLCRGSTHSDTRSVIYPRAQRGKLYLKQSRAKRFPHRTAKSSLFQLNLFIYFFYIHVYLAFFSFGGSLHQPHPL